VRFKALTVKNFQRHQALSVTFSPTITSIQGATDSGKSSLLRALRWICLNDFGGSDFVREGAAEAQATLRFRHRKEDHELVRVKGNRVNTYTLDDVEFKAFATNVPDEVAGCLRLNEINFQGQHDAPFWFQETAGEVSRRLNAVVDLSVIDNVLSGAAATVREAESMARASEQRLTELDEAQEKLEPQLARISHYETLKQQNEAYEEQTETSDHLASLLAQCGDYSTQLARLRPQIKAAGVLRKSLAAWFQQERQRASLEQIAQELKQLQRIQRPPDFRPVLQSYNIAEETEQEVSNLEALVNTIRRAIGTAQYTAGAAKEAALVYHKSTKGERCPMCQNPI